MDRSVQKELMTIPGIGKSISEDLWNIGIHSISDLRDKDPEKLYRDSNNFEGVVQDRCLLYVFRCAVYYARHTKHDPEKLKWWNWQDTPNKAKKLRNAPRHMKA